MKASDVLSVLSASLDWKSLLRMIVEAIGIPKIMTTARMKAVNAALAEQYPNMKAKARAEIAKVAVEAFLKDLL
jgi:hypothetical protein